MRHFFVLIFTALYVGALPAADSATVSNAGGASSASALLGRNSSHDLAQSK